MSQPAVRRGVMAGSARMIAGNQRLLLVMNGRLGRLRSRPLSSPKRTSSRTCCEVREVPIRDSCTAAIVLFDHLVGAGEYCRWNCETQRFSGLEIDHQFVLGRRLDGHVSRLLALEDAIDVAGRSPILVDIISSIRNQAAFGDAVAAKVDRRKFVS